MSCVILGDSLAVGVAGLMPECVMEAAIGATSTRHLAQWPDSVAADLVVISLGLNDGGDATEANLRAVRSRALGRRVVWLLPIEHRAGLRETILRVAAEHRDQVVDTLPFVDPHPAGYGAIVAIVREGGR